MRYKGQQCKDYQKVAVIGGGSLAKGTEERTSVGRMTVGSIDSDREIVNQQTAVEAMPAFFAQNPVVTFMHGFGGNVGHCVGWEALRRASGEGHQSIWTPTADVHQVDAIGVKTVYGEGYGFGTSWGVYQVDWIWKMIEQGNLRTHSVGFAGYSGGETEDGIPIVNVARINEYASTTVPAQEEAVFEVQRAATESLHLCQECGHHAKAALEDVKKGLDPFHLEVFLRGLVTFHQAKSHRKKEPSPEELRDAAKAFVDLGKTLLTRQGA